MLFLVAIVLISSQAAAEPKIVKTLECTFLMNYDTRHDTSTGCIFFNVQSNSSVYFSILDTYKGFPIDLDAFEILEFNNSSLDHIPNKLLEHFTSVEVLDVSNSSLTSVCGLEGGTKLHTLQANYNHIKSLNENIFAQNRRLIELDLSHNLISYLRPSIFTKAPNLMHLNLAHNLFQDVVPAFQHLHALKFFDLSHNYLEHLLPLNGLHNVEVFNLNDNFIETVSADAFMKMKSLRVLDLRNNEIFSIYLEFNSTVTYVDLSQNILQNLEVASDIATLNASKNKLRFLTAKSGIQIFSLNLSNNLLKETNGLRGLKSLRHLNLAGNHFNYITSRTFWNLDNLIEINLSKNFLKHVNLYHFSNLNFLQSLWLSNNEITRMKVTHKNFENILPQLREIGLAGNPWSCKYLVHMVNSFAGKGVRMVNDIDEAINDFEGAVLNIPCHSENKLQECRHEMETLKLAYEAEIDRLNGVIEALEFDFSNKTDL